MVQPWETRRGRFWGVNQIVYRIPKDENMIEQDNKIVQI